VLHAGAFLIKMELRMSLPYAGSPALQALMGGLIDYAGLFPPATLTLPAAIANYGRYRQEPDRWMLGRFIMPAARLAELESVPGTPADPLPLAVLGRGGRDSADFLDNLQADVEAMLTFRRQHGDSVSLEVFEVRLPVEVVTAGREHTVVDLLAAAAEWLATLGPIRPFYEAPLSPDDPNWPAHTTTLIRGIAAHNQGHQRAGFKLRCGGVTADAFPTPAQAAQALLLCRDSAVPLKATAGLHHLLRHFSREVNTTMHGFLNLFGAGVLAHVHRLGQTAVAAILADEEAAHFRFTDELFTWCDLSATVGEIHDIRRRWLLSYGSCSFDEPRDDLRALGLLETVS
jgi:hypothetical protein